MKTLIAFVALAAAALTAQAAPCDADKFEIVSKTGRMDADYLYVVGKVRNNNAVACGVELKVDLYDRARNLIDTDESWPASTTNIKAGESYSFKLMMRRERGVTSYSVDPVRARVWK